MMSITHSLKGLFPSPAARTAAVLTQECACSLQNKAGGSLYLSAQLISRGAFKMIISALISLISAGKNGKNERVHKRQKQCCFQARLWVP
jgi:hypothetical protein